MNREITKREVRPFLDEFERQRKNTTSNLDAYERVERDHETITGHRRYNDYENFRVVRCRKKNR